MKRVATVLLAILAVWIFPNVLNAQMRDEEGPFRVRIGAFLRDFEDDELDERGEGAEVSFEYGPPGGVFARTSLGLLQFEEDNIDGDGLHATLGIGFDLRVGGHSQSGSNSVSLSIRPSVSLLYQRSSVDLTSDALQRLQASGFTDADIDVDDELGFQGMLEVAVCFRESPLELSVFGGWVSLEADTTLSARWLGFPVETEDELEFSGWFYGASVGVRF